MSCWGRPHNSCTSIPSCEWCTSSNECLPVGDCINNQQPSWYNIGEYSCPRPRISTDCIYVGNNPTPTGYIGGKGQYKGESTTQNPRSGGRSNCNILSMEHCIADPRCEVCNRPYGFGGYDPNIPSTYCANRGQCRTNQNQNQTRSQDTMPRPPVPGPPVPGPPDGGLHSMIINYVNQHGGTGGIQSQYDPHWNDWEGSVTEMDLRGLVNSVRSNQRLHNAIMSLANNPRMSFHNIAKNVEAQLMRNGNTQRIYNQTKDMAMRNVNTKPMSNQDRGWGISLKCNCSGSPTCCYVVIALIVLLILL